MLVRSTVFQRTPLRDARKSRVLAVVGVQGELTPGYDLDL